MEQLLASFPTLIQLIAEYAPMAVGFAVPIVVEAINRDIKLDWLKWVVTVAVCAIVAVLLNIQKLQFGDVYAVVDSLYLIFIESQAAFHLYFKNSTLRASMQRQAVPAVVTQ